MESENTHLRAVLPVSISQAKGLREKLRCVHRRVATSRCGGMAGLVSGCGENFRFPYSCLPYYLAYYPMVL